MARKYDDGITWTIYLSKSVVSKAKLKAAKLGVRLSNIINEFLEKWVNEGEPLDPETRYEELKRRFFNLVKRTESLTSELKRRGAFDELVRLAEELGLDMEDLSNVEDVIAKLDEEYGGGLNEDINLFIDLLEATRKRIVLGKQLKEFRERRRRNYSSGDSSFAEARPDKDSVPRAEDIPRVRQSKAEKD